MCIEWETLHVVVVTGVSMSSTGSGSMGEGVILSEAIAAVLLANTLFLLVRPVLP